VKGNLIVNVSLTPELEELVQQKVQSGMYHTASEVIREGLRLLKEQDIIREMRLEELRREVKAGFEQIERGGYTRYASGEEIAEWVLAEGRRRTGLKKSE
jgi:antitoxin ParD1/3/4